jgi:hypothetical protein
MNEAAQAKEVTLQAGCASTAGNKEQNNGILNHV